MPKVTQKGEPVFETVITQGHHLDGDEASHLLLKLLDILGYSVYRTNDTKHGETTVKLRRNAPSISTKGNST